MIPSALASRDTVFYGGQDMGMVPLAVKEPSMKTEWVLYELSQRIALLDKRDPDYPEGLLYAPATERERVILVLDEIDQHWWKRLELLQDPSGKIEERLLHD